MSTFDEIATWLRATIEGDRATAVQAGGCEWNLLDGIYIYPSAGPDEVIIMECNPIALDNGAEIPVSVHAPHVVRHDPRETIARCDAELRLIDYFREPFENGNLDEDGLRLLAFGYRHRAGYKPEWSHLA